MGRLRKQQVSEEDKNTFKTLSLVNKSFKAGGKRRGKQDRL